MVHTITLIPGDGIGPEVTDAVLQILKAAGVAIDWDVHQAGLVAVERGGTPLPTEPRAGSRLQTWAPRLGL